MLEENKDILVHFQIQNQQFKSIVKHLVLKDKRLIEAQLLYHLQIKKVD
jgi:hypothetical protein